jgi:hypothetical protein
VIEQGITAGWIVDRIVGAGHDKYQFDTREEGCKHWIMDQVELLALLLTDKELLRIKEDVRKNVLWLTKKGLGYYK